MSTTTTATAATTICLLLAVAAATTAAAASGMTHLHFYIHGTFQGANATTASLVPSPLGGNSFGAIGAFDDVLREGPGEASRYLGRMEGFLVQVDLRSSAALCTMLNLVFTDGDYNGSTLLVDGRVDLAGAGPVERAVVGGTGRFRRARGYSLMTMLPSPTPSTGVFEMDLYVNMAS